jgi:hypothetical protein
VCVYSQQNIHYFLALSDKPIYFSSTRFPFILRRPKWTRVPSDIKIQRIRHFEYRFCLHFQVTEGTKFSFGVLDKANIYQIAGGY